MNLGNRKNGPGKNIVGSIRDRVKFEQGPPVLYPFKKPSENEQDKDGSAAGEAEAPAEIPAEAPAEAPVKEPEAAGPDALKSLSDLSAARIASARKALTKERREMIRMVFRTVIAGFLPSFSSCRSY